MKDLEALAAELGEALKAAGQTVAVAESSSGGLISAALLSVPGASKYYLGGAVVYTGKARMALMDLTRESVAGMRSASEPYALLLARTARERHNATWGVSETGAAGPTGNGYGDAAGHTCIAVSGPVETAITLETGSDDRAANMRAFARKALEVLRDARCGCRAGAPCPHAPPAPGSHPTSTRRGGLSASIAYESPAPHVARIVLDRPEARNAQDTRLLYELNDAFDRAARDDGVKVIILAANGPHFSSGHDLREGGAIADQMARFDPVGTWCGFGCAGAEGRMAREKEIYLGLSERWRNIPKPTIAAVQGKCIAGGLMLVWPCDLIVAADDASFADNTVGMGVGGVEYFAHPWELGPRKAKELLFTADWLSAQEARALGMVNQVVPAAELSAYVLALAERIATKPMFALKLAKEAVNAAEDAQGRVGAMGTAFALHQLAHSHNMQVHGLPVDPSGLQVAPRAKPA